MKLHQHYIAVKVFFFLVIAGACAIMIRNYLEMIDNEELLSRIITIGPKLLLILTPYIFVILADTLGWINTFSNKIPYKYFGRLLLLRFATESLQTSLPGGAAYAELVRPYLLKKHLNLPYTASITANLITKTNILLAQVIFFICGILVLSLYYNEGITRDLHLNCSVLYTASVILITSIILLIVGLYKKDLLLQIIKESEKIHLSFLRKLTAKAKQPCIQINSALSEFYQQNKPGFLITILFFFLTWILMAVESLIIIRIIGLEANLFQMIIIESLISFIRIIFFFLPGAVGPQDIGIIMLFTLTGLPEPLLNSVVFVILKRSKELFWMLTGYVILIIIGIEPGNLLRIKRSLPEFNP